MAYVMHPEPNVMYVSGNAGKFLFKREYDEEEFRFLVRSLACVTGSRVVLREKNVIALAIPTVDQSSGGDWSVKRFCSDIFTGVPVWEAFQLHARRAYLGKAYNSKESNSAAIDEMLLRYAMSHEHDADDSDGAREESLGDTLSGCGPTAFYTRSVALLNDAREDALCETLDKLRLHSFYGGDIESGVGQVETTPFANVLQKLCVIDPLSDSWSDEAQVAAQMRMALWGLEGATGRREERDEGESLRQVAKFSWADRARGLTLVGERSRKEGADGWPLRRLVCTIARPADQGGFGLRLAVESPAKETEKLFEECLVSCDGATWPLDSGDGLDVGRFFGIPDYRCEVRLRDGSIAAVVPASMAWRVAYGTWSFVEPKGGEDPHVVLTCGEDVPELTRMALLEATGSSDGIDETLRKHVGWALSKIGMDIRRWRLANEGVDDELERQRRRVSEFLSRGPQQDGVPWGGTSFVAYDRGQLSLEKRFEASAREREGTLRA